MRPAARIFAPFRALLIFGRLALPRSTPGSHHKGVMQMAEGNGSDDEKGPDQDKTERSDAAKESGHDIVRECDLAILHVRCADQVTAL